MFTLNAKTREKNKKQPGFIPAVVYGPGVKNANVCVDEKEFKKVFKQAGESSLVELNVEKDPSAGSGKESRPVLVHEIQKDPVSGNIIHIDFYQADLTEKVQVTIPLVFEGSAPAEKELGGTLNKNILEIEVRALPQDLPRGIKVNIGILKTFEDHILIKDLIIPANVQFMKNLDEIVCAVLPPQKIEEELAVPIEEKVEEVEKIEKEEKEEIIEEPKEEKTK